MRMSGVSIRRTLHNEASLAIERAVTGLASGHRFDAHEAAGRMVTAQQTLPVSRDDQLSIGPVLNPDVVVQVPKRAHSHQALTTDEDVGQTRVDPC